MSKVIRQLLWIHFGFTKVWDWLSNIIGKKLTLFGFYHTQLKTTLQCQILDLCKLFTGPRRLFPCTSAVALVSFTTSGSPSSAVVPTWISLTYISKSSKREVLKVTCKSVLEFSVLQYQEIRKHLNIFHLVSNVWAFI